MVRTKEQNIRFHALVGKLGISAEQKMELVQEVSDGRCSSSAELLVQEMECLINHLQQLANKQEPDAATRMRRKVCALFHELEYEKPNGSLDYDRINGWMLKFSYLHKLLNGYKAKELPALLTQVESMLKKEYQ